MNPKLKDGKVIGWTYNSSMGWDDTMEEIKNHFDRFEYEAYLEAKFRRESE